MSLIGASVHNFIDGVVIAASFIVSTPLGFTTIITIAATDLVPEIKKELDIKKSMATIFVFICGILIMWLVKMVFGG